MAAGIRDSAALRAVARTEPLLLPLLPYIVILSLYTRTTYRVEILLLLFMSAAVAITISKGALSSRNHIIMIMARALEVFSRFMGIIIK